jgi:uncharacterized protein (DUF4213/DUF364 family)
MINDPWRLYDALIEGVDPSWKVDYYTQGVTWCEVFSGDNSGIAMCIHERGPGPEFPDPVDGMSLQDMAAMVKSWNYLEASLGTAALNCYYNTVEKVNALGGFRGLEIGTGAIDPEKRKQLNAFIAFQDEIAGKKVAVVGHFPHIERKIGSISDLIIIERRPKKGDYPDPASEYILREHDYAFIVTEILCNHVKVDVTFIIIVDVRNNSPCNIVVLACLNIARVPNVICWHVDLCDVKKQCI